ncbi:pyridoxal-phosphate dependent enzyme [Paenibacillus hunanensis]|uniref:Cysteine synthase A n=1 Tax=Paenibacillus hunanensis TaxID=539262 RepID=A0ABU1IX75_9BACL|nr:pyridoxal-phosphate dependent enzyme [Paenibacillus hunanensis]MDR6243838.1 cysteine synthase A [Paenibacillus hunanensis]GGJ25246.1 cysteine synthase [Paenibacillus hunanensis]
MENIIESSLLEKLTEYEKLIGNTPLIELSNIEGVGTIYAKCEWYNATGSIKDRAAFAMIKNLLEENKDRDSSDFHILEYSGGNLALSLAHICKFLNISLTLVLSSAADKSLLSKLYRLNAEVILSDKSKGFWGVMCKAFDVHKENPTWDFLYQHHNKNNHFAHKNGTGSEIIQQLNGKQVDTWVASVGTGGTVTGVYDSLKLKYPSINMCIVSPAELEYGSLEKPNSLRKYAGSGGLGEGRKQRFVEEREMYIQSHYKYSFDDTLREMKRFYDNTGIKIGTSAAANLLASKEIIKEQNRNFSVVTVFPDQGSDEEWEACYRLDEEK